MHRPNRIRCTLSQNRNSFCLTCTRVRKSTVMCDDLQFRQPSEYWKGRKTEDMKPIYEAGLVLLAMTLSFALLGMVLAGFKKIRVRNAARYTQLCTLLILVLPMQ
jgi:hypothetical protein